jgi:hypothetical protein
MDVFVYRIIEKKKWDEMPVLNPREAG